MPRVHFETRCSIRFHYNYESYSTLSNIQYSTSSACYLTLVRDQSLYICNLEPLPRLELVSFGLELVSILNAASSSRSCCCCCCCCCCYPRESFITLVRASLLSWQLQCCHKKWAILAIATLPSFSYNTPVKASSPTWELYHLYECYITLVRFTSPK